MTTLTLEDIARKAGVSRSTVSRVINDKPNVRSHVRERVLQVIDETGYHPNLAARSLASQTSRVIGLVVPRSVQAVFTDPYFPRLIQGIAQGCNQYDHTLAFFMLHTQDEEDKLFPRIARRGLIDGIIIQVAQIGDELLPRLVNSEIPSIVAGRPEDVPNASYVDVANVAGAYTAVSHLIRLGRTRIATITGPRNTTAGQDRETGYRNALHDQGLPLDERLVVQSDFSEAGGYSATKRLLEFQPDAVFAASDFTALGALRAFRECGAAVPEDVAVVGFDDMVQASRAIPPLTTIRQPIRRLGIKLVETLLEIMQNGCQPPRRVVFDTELIIRQSCGADLQRQGK